MWSLVIPLIPEETSQSIELAIECSSGLWTILEIPDDQLTRPLFL
jgi:hypothetical protein